MATIALYKPQGKNRFRKKTTVKLFWENVLKVYQLERKCDT